MTAYDEWRKENPDWDRDWSQGASGVGEVGVVEISGVTTVGVSID